VKPQLPGDTRWNSQLTCIDTYLRNRPAYLAIVQEHEGAIDARIAGLINDFNLFKQVKDLSQQLKPIASTLDKLQSDKCGLAQACHEWLSLLKDDALQPHMENNNDRLQRPFNGL